MNKDFDSWNEVKKQTEERTPIFGVHEREIWWLSFGINVGVEIDGKHNYFERPALIIRKFNRDMLWVLPITSQIKSEKFHEPFSFNDKNYFVTLTQIRTVSTKRLLRKAGMLPRKSFMRIIWRVIGFLIMNEDPH